MVKRIDVLTEAQKAQMAPWADRWIEVGLSTEPADFDAFEVHARRCYEAAGIEWPGGIPVVRGEAGGNTHALVGTGFWRATPQAELQLGELTVPEGGVAYLAHPEHGYLGIAAGTYSVCRQREQADEIRMVAD